MISKEVVDVEAREGRGKNENRRLRARNMIPGIVYGMDLDPFAIAVSPRRIDEILATRTGRNTIFTLSLVGSDKKSTRAVMIKDLQRDPVKEHLLHVDFVRINLEKPVSIKVPINLVGTPEGVKNEGGVIDFITRQVAIECLPTEIPEQIDLDVVGLHLNQNGLVKDLQAGDNIKVLDDPSAPILAVIAPRGLEVAEVEEEAEEEAEEGAAPAEAKEGEEAATPDSQGS
jgi:large subunit ribosomal protein L25